MGEDPELGDVLAEPHVWVEGPWGTQRHKVERIGTIDLKGGLVPKSEEVEKLDVVE